MVVGWVHWRDCRSNGFFIGKIALPKRVFQESIIPRWRIPAVAMRVNQAETSIPTAMSDKNPKAKRKLQTQQEMQRKQKIEEQQRGQHGCMNHKS
jgi:hypothetical protein